MDKEALLKEASMRLMVQHKELTATSARMKDLLSQVDAMHVEMGDLRKDKCALQNAVQRVRSSNSKLWQVSQQLQYSKLSALLNPTTPATDIFAPIVSETDVQDGDMIPPTSDTVVRNNEEPTVPNENETRLDGEAVRRGGFQFDLPLIRAEQVQQRVVNISGKSEPKKVNISLRKEEQDCNSTLFISSCDNQGTTPANLYPTCPRNHQLTTINAVQTTNVDVCTRAGSIPPTTQQTCIQDYDICYESGFRDFTT